MPNQADYPITLIPGSVYQRPARLTAADLALLEEGSEQIILGTNPADVTEVWIYNPDSTFAGHVTLKYNDIGMTLTTLIDNTGAYELVNLDFKEIGNICGIEAGRYAVTVNFFSDWVGSEEGYQLYIKTISPDRKELQLYPVNVTSQSMADTTTFLTPSVPPEFANALIDQVFGLDLNPNPTASISAGNTLAGCEDIFPDTIQRIINAGLQQKFIDLFGTVMTASLNQALANLGADGFNYHVTQPEINAYISGAIATTLFQLTNTNQVDPRFQFATFVPTGPEPISPFQTVPPELLGQPILTPPTTFSITGPGGQPIFTPPGVFVPNNNTISFPIAGNLGVQ